MDANGAVSSLDGEVVQLQLCPILGCNCVTCAKHLGPQRMRQAPWNARLVRHCCREVSAYAECVADERPRFPVSSDDSNSGGSRGTDPEVSSEGSSEDCKDSFDTVSNGYFQK